MNNMNLKNIGIAKLSIEVKLYIEGGRVGVKQITRYNYCFFIKYLFFKYKNIIFPYDR